MKKKKRKYTKRAVKFFTNKTDDGSDNNGNGPKAKQQRQYVSQLDLKLITSDLTRFSRVFKNDIVICLNELSIKQEDLAKCEISNDLSEVVDQAHFPDIRLELETTKSIAGFEIMNLKTNNRLWISKPGWKCLTEKNT